MEEFTGGQRRKTLSPGVVVFIAVALLVFSAVIAIPFSVAAFVVLAIALELAALVPGLTNPLAVGEMMGASYVPAYLACYVYFFWRTVSDPNLRPKRTTLD